MALRKESNVVVSFQEVKELFRKHETELSSVIEKKELTFFESSVSFWEKICLICLFFCL